MVFVDPPSVTMVSNPDLATFSNNNYLVDMNHVGGAEPHPHFMLLPRGTVPTAPHNQHTPLVTMETAAGPFTSLSVAEPQYTHSPMGFRTAPPIPGHGVISHSMQTPVGFGVNPSPGNGVIPQNSSPPTGFGITPTPDNGINPYPGSYPYIVPTQSGMIPGVPSHTPQVGGVSVNAYPGSFTFNVPTQASPISGSPTQTYQSHGIYTNNRLPQCHAPGLGASWQHAVPTQMPWGDGMRHPYGVTTFTGDLGSRPGIVTVTQSMAPSMNCVVTGQNLWNVQEQGQNISGDPFNNVSRPRSSFTSTKSSRRLKRHASSEEMSSFLGVDNKVFISERKMLESMRELSLYPPRVRPLYPPRARPPQTTSLMSVRDRGQQHLREIEERLELDDSDDDSEPQSSSAGLGPTVEIIKGLPKDILKPASLLPQKLLEDITLRRCMEVVLWKPPGDFAKELAPKSSENSSQADNDFCWEKQDTTCLAGRAPSKLGQSMQDMFNKHREELVTMDTELFEGIDDEMQL